MEQWPLEQWLVIGISGVTCSGKTTLAQSLQKHFKDQIGCELKPGVELNRVELVNQDTYFRSVDDPNHQKIEKLQHLNWEIIESMDMDKMISDVMEILGPKFLLYKTRSSAIASHHENLFTHHFIGHPYQQKSRLFRGNDDLFPNDEDCNFKKIVKHNSLLNILIIEGFLIFASPVLFDLLNVKFHLHVPYEVCYARRSKRTYDPPDVKCYFEMVVWPSYEKHLREFKDKEDVLFLNGDASPEKCLKFVIKSLIDEL
jgi:nicotinamide/nicotinate riboside kinase